MWLRGAAHEVVANAVSRECAFAVQQNEFVLSQRYGIDNINFLAITSGLACKGQLCFYQLCDSSREVLRCRHFPLLLVTLLVLVNDSLSYYFFIEPAQG